ncbi:MAG: YggS family pyridoxal phosphate-dependent enzyme, partial [Acidothermaceae bacterium]
LGIGDVGENRDQEAAAKVAEIASRWGEPGDHPVRWHFIGALQTNKCASVVRYASVVHSVDRLRLVEALGSAGRRRAKPLDCLVQVDLDAEPKPARSGARPGEVAVIAEAIVATPGLRLAGVMAVAPLGADPRQAFASLAAISAALQQQHPAATVVSAGMSGDLEAAIAAGATHLRVGAALLGSRGHPG